MNIIVVNGSPRKKGATNKLNKALIQKLLEIDDSIQIGLIELSDINPKYCTGCLYCYRKGSCHIKEDSVDEISKKISACDGLILSSPTYGGSVSGLFKSFIDRGHFLVEQMLHDKPCILVTSYENAQGKQALSYMNQLIMTSGGYAVGKIGAKTMFNENPITSSIERKIDKAANKLYTIIKKEKKSKPLFAKIFNHVAFNIVLKPHALKNIEQYRGVIEHWVEYGLINEEVLQ